jgi:hypothetical protein
LYDGRAEAERPEHLSTCLSPDVMALAISGRIIACAAHEGVSSDIILPKFRAIFLAARRNLGLSAPTSSFPMSEQISAFLAAELPVGCVAQSASSARWYDAGCIAERGWSRRVDAAGDCAVDSRENDDDIDDGLSDSADEDVRLVRLPSNTEEIDVTYFGVPQSIAPSSSSLPMGMRNIGSDPLESQVAEMQADLAPIVAAAREGDFLPSEKYYSKPGRGKNRWTGFGQSIGDKFALLKVAASIMQGTRIASTGVEVPGLVQSDVVHLFTSERTRFLSKVRDAKYPDLNVPVTVYNEPRLVEWIMRVLSVIRVPLPIYPPRSRNGGWRFVFLPNVPRLTPAKLYDHLKATISPLVTHHRGETISSSMIEELRLVVDTRYGALMEGIVVKVAAASGNVALLEKLGINAKRQQSLSRRIDAITAASRTIVARARAIIGVKERSPINISQATRQLTRRIAQKEGILNDQLRTGRWSARASRPEFDFKAELIAIAHAKGGSCKGPTNDTPSR